MGDLLAGVDRGLERFEGVAPADHDDRIGAAEEERQARVPLDPVALVLEAVDLDQVCRRVGALAQAAERPGDLLGRPTSTSASYEAAGYEVLGVAPTGRAARELGDQAGIRARTLDRLLIDLDELGDQLAARCVIVFDEAGMAPTRATARILEAAERASAKVVAIGDPGQLASVQAGGWLRAVGERIGALRLTHRGDAPTRPGGAPGARRAPRPVAGALPGVGNQGGSRRDLPRP